MDTGKRSPKKVLQTGQHVDSKPYESQIECLKDIILGLKAEIEKHDKECNLTTREQQIERLRNKEDELSNTTKELDELRQFLSDVKSEIDSMHILMSTQEQDAFEGRDNALSSNNLETGFGDSQSERIELWQSVASLQARMNGARAEIAKVQIENEHLKDDLRKAKADNLYLNARLKDQDRDLNSHLADLITKVNQNSEVLKLFYDHYRGDVGQVDLLHGRTEALYAELQEIETRVDSYAGDLRLVSGHLQPDFSKCGIPQPDNGPGGRVAKKVRCLIEQALLKPPGSKPQVAGKKPIEANKVGLDVSPHTDKTLYDTDHSLVVSAEMYSNESPVDETKAPDVPGVDEISLHLIRLTLLLHPLSTISSTANEASLTLKSLLHVKSVYSPQLVKDGDLASIDSAIKGAKNTKPLWSKTLCKIRYAEKQVFSEPWLETYATVFWHLYKIIREMNNLEKGIVEPTKPTNQQRDRAGTERLRRVK
ncbi:hypothetical protein FOFC_20530 [Fusarium oxysporum]|nr:hypothetical protein FOFC_20530 [Fusarium oxysporum]